MTKETKPEPQPGTLPWYQVEYPRALKSIQEIEDEWDAEVNALKKANAAQSTELSAIKSTLARSSSQSGVPVESIDALETIKSILSCLDVRHCPRCQRPYRFDEEIKARLCAVCVMELGCAPLETGTKPRDEFRDYLDTFAKDLNA